MNLKSQTMFFYQLIKTELYVKVLKKIYRDFGEDYDFYFANGGDQDNEICPEINICNKFGIKLIDGLGDKIQSSSWLLKK